MSSGIMTTTDSEQPYFDFELQRNVTVTVGQTGFLHCRVERLGDKDVSKWFKCLYAGNCFSVFLFWIYSFSVSLFLSILIISIFLILVVVCVPSECAIYSLCFAKFQFKYIPMSTFSWAQSTELSFSFNPYLSLSLSPIHSLPVVAFLSDCIGSNGTYTHTHTLRKDANRICIV